MAMPPPKRIEMGHFTEFSGRRNYPQSWGTRPACLVGHVATSIRFGIGRWPFRDPFACSSYRLLDLRRHGLDRKTAGARRRTKRLVITLDLIGICYRVIADGLVKYIVRAHVAA